MLQWFLWVGLPIVKPEAIMVSVMGGFLGGGLAVLVWLGVVQPGRRTWSAGGRSC